jgi:hypothetical protein
MVGDKGRHSSGGGGDALNANDNFAFERMLRYR